jgi:hypothetical protein
MTHNVCMNKNASLSKRSLIHSNGRLASELWGNEIQKRHLRALRDLTERFSFSVGRGEVQLLNGNWYVTHAGLLRIAQRRRCHGIKTSLQKVVSDPIANRWAFKATVYKSPRSRGFVGYGDADPSNVSPLVRGSELRLAETRAVSRALRKAYGIGLCSVEELGYLTSRAEQPVGKGSSTPHSNGTGSGNGQPRLRDRLCLLIRQHQLDPAMVKRFAAEFCGTQELREAGRDLVESFITHLSKWAARDRAGLLCKLNSFATVQEAKP